MRCDTSRGEGCCSFARSVYCCIVGRLLRLCICCGRRTMPRNISNSLGCCPTLLLDLPVFACLRNRLFRLEDLCGITQCLPVHAALVLCHHCVSVLDVLVRAKVSRLNALWILQSD